MRSREDIEAAIPYGVDCSKTTLLGMLFDIRDALQQQEGTGAAASPYDGAVLEVFLDLNHILKSELYSQGTDGRPAKLPCGCPLSKK